MKVSEFFYSSDSEKSTLHRRITPTKQQRDLQSERWTDLSEFLKGDLGEKTGLPMSSWLQGSYKMGTQIRPSSKSGEFDIDLGIYFGWPGEAVNDVYSPQDLKTLVQESLGRYSQETDDDTRLGQEKERCNRIHYPGGFHIDVPTYHIDAELDERSLATLSHGWEDSDPKRLYVWFRSNFEDDTDTQIQRIVRYLKMYATLNLKETPSSILITVLAVEAYKKMTETELNGDDAALRHVSEQIASRLQSNVEVPNPVNQAENLNRMNEADTDTFIEALWSLVAIADRALASGSQFETFAIWAEAFQHFFPSPVSSSTALVPVGFVPVVDVKAVSNTNIHGIFNGVDGIGPIPRECSITFTLRNSNQLPQGSRVHWMVRNEGEEAELINDMGHLAGMGSIGREERSAYRGTHFMDITVFSAIGTVIGYKRLPVVIHGVVVPPRNPKKPGYVRYGIRR